MCVCVWGGGGGAGQERGGGRAGGGREGGRRAGGQEGEGRGGEGRVDGKTTASCTDLLGKLIMAVGYAC